jgi:hypothetical protein
VARAKDDEPTEGNHDAKTQRGRGQLGSHGVEQLDRIDRTEARTPSALCPLDKKPREKLTETQKKAKVAFEEKKKKEAKKKTQQEINKSQPPPNL